MNDSPVRFVFSVVFRMLYAVLGMKCAVRSTMAHAYRLRCCALCALSVVLISGCQEPRLYRDTRVAMGTFVEVISSDSRAASIAFDQIKRVEGLFSRYDESSQVWRLNRLGSLAVSPDVVALIARAQEFTRLSEGAFDITVAPLMDLWGFTDRRFRVPAESEIAAILRRIGADKIVLDSTNNVVKLTVPGMEIDFGAIAEGYAVDCAVRSLREARIEHCLINLGGEIYCLGDKRPGRRGLFGFVPALPWRVAIQDPKGRGLVGEIALRNRAVATSGNYEQFFEKDGRRFSHIMDPRSGRPADAGVTSVTVIADDCTTADALATAVSVLGRARSARLLAHFPGVEVRIVEHE